jgi:hypothetical protein
MRMRSFLKTFSTLYHLSLITNYRTKNSSQFIDHSRTLLKYNFNSDRQQSLLKPKSSRASKKFDALTYLKNEFRKSTHLPGGLGLKGSFQF